MASEQRPPYSLASWAFVQVIVEFEFAGIAAEHLGPEIVVVERVIAVFRCQRPHLLDSQLFVVRSGLIQALHFVRAKDVVVAVAKQI